jgi:hypothetical protein
MNDKSFQKVTGWLSSEAYTKLRADAPATALITAIGRKATREGPLYNITAGGEGFDEETMRRSVAARAELFSTNPEWAAQQHAHFAKGRAKMAELRKSDPSWNDDHKAKTAENIAKGRAKKDWLRMEDEVGQDNNVTIPDSSFARRKMFWRSAAQTMPNMPSESEKMQRAAVRNTLKCTPTILKNGRSATRRSPRGRA